MMINRINPNNNQISALTSNDYLGKLSVGSVIRAQVVDIMPESVVLRLSDNSIVSAQSNLAMDIDIGEHLNLTIRDKDDTRITLQLAKAENTLKAEGEQLKNALISIKTVPDEKNMEIAKQMVESGIPLVKEAFASIIKNLHLLSGNTPDKNVFLLANNIPVNQESIDILNDFVTNKDNIGNQLSDIMGDLDSVDGDTKNEIIGLKNLINGLFINIEKSDINKLITRLKESLDNEEIEKAVLLLKDKLNSFEGDKMHKVKDLLEKLDKSIEFVKKINYVTYYTQVPIDINDFKTTVELYVFKDSVKSKNENGSVSSFLLTLTTANLGYIETFLKLHNKRLECDFRAERKNTIDFIKKHISELSDNLEAKGYKTARIGYSKVDVKTNILNVKNLFPNLNITAIDERV